jgi:uncharacterized YigZ family protein
MSSPTRYPIPAGEYRQEEEISRSRFITTVAPARTLDDAQQFIQRIREEFPDATHNCWAYVVGPPGSTARIGMSDDGEPHGTAGKPMLGMLLHGDTGDTVAVVTRYFGGTKLGTGGLVRAYGGCLQRALQAMPRSERVERAGLVVRLDYASLEAARASWAAHEAEVTDQEFGEDVRLTMMVPVSNREALERALLDATRGRVTILEAAGTK